MNRSPLLGTGGGLGDEDPSHHPTRTQTPPEHLDLDTVLEVVEAVSAETDLERLIDAVMRLYVAQAGAERGLLVGPGEGAFGIQAEAEVSSDGVKVAQRQSVVSSDELPGSVFQHVLRTRESVLLHDASAEHQFADDEYFRRRRARSVLCMPLLNQRRVVGLIYLENNSASGVFTAAPMTRLKLLASHAAVALENARLYRDLRERAQRAVERESRLIIDTIPGLVALLTATGDVEMVNRQLTDYFGQTLEELRQWGTNDTVHPEDLPHVVELFTRAIQSGSPYTIVQRFKRRDGVYRWFENRGFPLRDEHGRTLRWCVLLADVDERKRAEDALRESERESRLIVDSIPGLIAVFTPGGQVESVNRRVLEYFGGTLEDHQRWGGGAFTHPEDLPRIVESFTRAISSGEPFDEQVRARRIDGAYRWFRSLASPLRDTNGHIVRWYNLLIDIDERKHAEEALNRARSELAHVARVTTLSALTASIAHEVNQPLSGIITNAGTCLRMLDADPPNVDGARETARRTIRDGNRAAEVITRLRALFSKKELTLEPMDLNDAIREVLALSSSDLQRNRVILRSELADTLPSVLGDRVQLQQVILNLLLNAAEAMSGVNDRTREMTIRTEREGGDRVRVAVRDTGAGVDPLNADKLFDAFYTTKSGGMGIGLSVSRSIVERHHGHLWVEANDGPGATFAFTIPCIS